MPIFKLNFQPKNFHRSNGNNSVGNKTQSLYLYKLINFKSDLSIFQPGYKKTNSNQESPKSVPFISA